MTTVQAILLAVALIFLAICWSSPTSYNYHTDLKNIDYQLSRIADALNKKKGERNG